MDTHTQKLCDMYNTVLKEFSCRKLPCFFKFHREKSPLVKLLHGIFPSSKSPPENCPVLISMLFFTVAEKDRNYVDLQNYTKIILQYAKIILYIRGGSRTAAASKVELFVIIVNGSKPLTIITKSSTLDVAAVLDPPLYIQK